MCTKMTDTSSSNTHPAELLKQLIIDPSNEEVNVDVKTKEESESSMSMPVIRPRPRVSFSDKSSLNIYKNYRDELHRSNIAYSLQDRDLFNREATQEADRIKTLIINAPQKSRVGSVKYLLKNKIVSKEELVGIEHLVLEKSNKSEIRKNHSIAVLKKQQEQQRQNLPLQDPTIALSKFARKISLESRNIARARAALCCESNSNESFTTARVVVCNSKKC